MNRRHGEPAYLSFGTLMTRSFENLSLIWREILAYIAAAAVLGFALRLAGENISGIIGFIAYFVGQYWLFHALLKRRGMLGTESKHFFAFVGLALVLAIPIMLGLAALVLPGLFLVARWIAAPAFIVARGEGVFAAIDNSSQSVRGNTVKLAEAVVVMFLIASALSIITSGIESALSGFDFYRGARPIEMIESQLLPLLLLGLSTATYELLGSEDTTIEEVFG